MLLTFDIGNTNMVVGVFKGQKLLASWRLQTNDNRTADEVGVLVHQMLEIENIKRQEIKSVIVSSVVPHVMYSMTHMIQKYFGREPMVVGPGTKTGITVKYDNPNQVGADRIVNAVAGVHKYGAPLILVDFGTATTFCAINENKEYLGGSILPGIKISSEALYARAAKLTRVELMKMDKTICTNTTESVQAGIYFGYVGSVEYIIRKMKEELGGGKGKEIKVIATGGFASLIAEGTAEITSVDKNLTLDGLFLLHKMNKKDKNGTR